MTVASALAIYFVAWWVVLFAVLPFGVRSQHEEGGAVEGTDPGAPVAHGMAMKLVWTTIISGVVFGVGWGAYRLGFYNVESLARLMGFQR
jgi:predicted secreted protein